MARRAGRAALTYASDVTKQVQERSRFNTWLLDSGQPAEPAGFYEDEREANAHHKTRWVDGGDTNLKDGVTLCHWHHMKAHDTSYTTTYQPNGDVTFHRRQ